MATELEGNEKITAFYFFVGGIKQAIFANVKDGGYAFVDANERYGGRNVRNPKPRGRRRVHGD